MVSRKCVQLPEELKIFLRDIDMMTEKECVLYKWVYKANVIFLTLHPKAKDNHGTHSAITDISKMATRVI